MRNCRSPRARGTFPLIASIDCTRSKAFPMDFPDLSVSSVVISACVTASKVLRVDSENWLYSVGCELSWVIWLYSAYHSSISFFCTGLSSSYVPCSSCEAVGALFCALSVVINKNVNGPVNHLNICSSGDRLIKQNLVLKFAGYAYFLAWHSPLACASSFRFLVSKTQYSPLTR